MQEIKFLLIKSIYLVVFSLEMQRRLIKTKVHYKFFYSVSKETTNKPQTFQSSSCKKSFLQCAIDRYNLLRWMFFILFDNWKSLFFVKVCRYFEVLSATILQLSMKQVFWKKLVFYVISSFFKNVLNSKISFTVQNCLSASKSISPYLREKNTYDTHSRK